MLGLFKPKKYNTPEDINQLSIEDILYLEKDEVNTRIDATKIKPYEKQEAFKKLLNILEGEKKLKNEGMRIRGRKDIVDYYLDRKGIKRISAAQDLENAMTKIVADEAVKRNMERIDANANMADLEKRLAALKKFGGYRRRRTKTKRRKSTRRRQTRRRR